jgi:hypothetical protein
LTRRRDHDRSEESWLIYYGDVHVGTIAQCVGNPGTAPNAPKWQWRCGFYSGSRPFVAKRTEADFQAWREHQAWTAEKYRRFDRGERMPPDWQNVQQTNLIQ